MWLGTDVSVMYLGQGPRERASVPAQLLSESKQPWLLAALFHTAVWFKAIQLHHGRAAFQHRQLDADKGPKKWSNGELQPS